MVKLIIEIKGGIISFGGDGLPACIDQLEIRDYDCEGIEDEQLLTDEYGVKFWPQ